MSKRKYSAIWLHFEEENGQRAKCKYCKATLSFNQRSQSNLKRHLISKHHLKTLQMHLKKPKSNTVIKQAISQGCQSAPTNRLEEIDRKVLKMIAKGHHSFRLVEDNEFKKFINNVSNCFGYNLPSWSVLVNGLDGYIDMKLFDSIKRRLHSATAICLTVNEWTSTTNMRYVAVTAYYINQDTQVKSHLLACGEFENKQRAEIVYNFLQKVNTGFEIDNKIIAAVSGNYPNILVAIQQAGWAEILCFAHSLNEIAQMVIDEIAEIVNKAKNIIEYFNKNVHALKEVQITTDQMCLPSLKFKQDTSHKWHSTFEMLKCICREKNEVITALSHNHSELLLDIDDWNTIEETISILKPICEAVGEMSEEKYVSVSKAVVLCNLLENFNFQSSANKKVSNIIMNLRKTIKTRFGNLENIDLFAESIILDPRFKRKGFKNEWSYEQALKLLKEKVSDINLPIDEQLTTFQSTDTDTESIWRSFDLDTNRRADNKDAAFELDKYISEEYLDRKKDPLLWWKEKKHIYPRVYTHALSRLCIVATIIQ